MLLPLLVLLIAPAAEPNDAEKLFREMETKITKAKNIECVYEMHVKFEGGPEGSVKGTLLIGEGNKVRKEEASEHMGMKEKNTQISDGSRGTLDAEKEASSELVPSWIHQAMRASITRVVWGEVGFVIAADEKAKNSEYGLEQRHPVSDFKLGKKEMIGKQEAQVVQYTLTSGSGDSNRTIAVTVWIDTKTQLPLKRLLVVTEDKKKATFNETFTKLDIDAKIDPKQFELPKK